MQIAGWCNGSTLDSGSGNLGSSPSPAALRFSLRSNLSVCESSCFGFSDPSLIKDMKIEVTEEQSDEVFNYSSEPSALLIIEATKTLSEAKRTIKIDVVFRLYFRMRRPVALRWMHQQSQKKNNSTQRFKMWRALH